MLALIAGPFGGWCFGLVVVDDFNAVCGIAGPDETDAVLAVDANAVLAVAVAGELLEVVAGRASQVVAVCSGCDQKQFPTGGPLDILRQLL